MMYADYKRKIADLKKDNKHGATYIETALFRILINAGGRLSHKEFLRLLEFARKWSTVMVNVLNLLDAADRFTNSPQADVPLSLSILRKRITAARDNVCHKAAALIDRFDAVATISASGLVQRALELAANRGWKGTVYVAESRPMLEGRLLAKSLASLPLRVICGTDCQILSLLDEVGAGFVGADAIARRFFVNKIGTGALARGLGLRKRLYVLADSSKFRALPEDVEIPPMSTTEVWRGHPRKVTVINTYFERIPLKPNIVIVSEDG